jgi:hypothetical protein
VVLSRSEAVLSRSEAVMGRSDVVLSRSEMVLSRSEVIMGRLEMGDVATETYVFMTQRGHRGGRDYTQPFSVILRVTFWANPGVRLSQRLV